MTTRLTEKISGLVRQQLPEFVRSDYTTFVAFVEAYYRFLEQDRGAQEIIQHANHYSDIDKTSAGFLDYFLKNYGYLIPKSVLANKPQLIKRLNDLYTSKGSDLSFKLLFRILYDANVTIKHPYDYVLKPSDGIWEQQISLRVLLVTGSVDDILNRNLRFEKDGVPYQASIYRIKDLGDGLYEVFLKTNVIPPYEIYSKVYVTNSTGVIFTGTVQPTPTTYEIINSGIGFRAGQIFTINLAGAVNTVVQIRTVNSTGGITSLKFINYGYNFPNSTISIDLYNDLTIASRSLEVSTKTNTPIDQFQMVLTYLGTEPTRYFLTDYVEGGFNGTLLAETNSGTGTTGSTAFSTATGDASAATISFQMGAVGRYPGLFTSNKGFLSEPDVRLQDDNLYQPFAYQLETDIDISKFYDIVKALIHPAGTNLFNSRVISSQANVKANVSVITRSNIFSEAYSYFNVTDAKALTVGRLVQDTTGFAESNTWVLYRAISDSLDTTESILQTFNSTKTDSVTTTDELLFGKYVNLVDSETPTDSDSKTFGKYINNTDSTVTLTESLFYTIENYAVSGYFAETYAGATTQLL